MITIALSDLNQLANLLLNELALGRLLQQQLDQEREHLRQQDLVALEQDCRRKSALLQKMNGLANERLTWMSEHQLPLAEHFLQHPSIREADNICQLWQQLATQYRHNRACSEQMNELVLTARRRVQQRLRLLRGTPQSTLIYNSKGSTNSQSSSRGYLQA
ncbi:flagellar export chaperone FlgN [Parathalassolituus penaei]|uniref:Flagellar export chaperone FlgN n=1 Tax=Parathalassolituus penaei TaxID=2997323 RepID=A0A9X3EFR8_9GAMM|nr:flagellar export chaperone FlgN [Parathalassolituus penaei]MCY0965914.1 flagellar export chaperone FlgN [Parathalassolituus penaei]